MKIAKLKLYVLTPLNGPAIPYKQIAKKQAAKNLKAK
jgi:hypothetical protein